MALRESRLNFQIASDQRKLARASKRESEAMKGISLLGTIFLPGAFLSVSHPTTALILISELILENSASHYFQRHFLTSKMLRT